MYNRAKKSGPFPHSKPREKTNDISQMAPFSIAPVEVPDGFVWDGDKFHFTYAEHVSKDQFLETVRRATSTPVIGWSVVQETTTEYDLDTQVVITQGHDHTHVGVMFQSRIRIRGSRKFDIIIVNENDPTDARSVHPHILPKVSMNQMRSFFTEYHVGRKYCVEAGKTIFKKPILHEFMLPQLFEFERAIMNEIVEAPNLFEACLAAEVKPRSVACIKTLREETASRAAKRFKHKFPRDSFILQFPPDWHMLHIYGASGLGKTKAAVAQLDNPCVIKPFDSIGCLEALCRMYDPQMHDGLVLDEADLSFMSRQQVIAFIDPDEDCTLDVRFKSFTLPSNLKKIIISNEHPAKLYPPDPFGAIARRMKVLHVTSHTYRGAPQPAWIPPPLPQRLAPPPRAPVLATGIVHMRDAAARAAAVAFGTQ